MGRTNVRRSAQKVRITLAFIISSHPPNFTIISQQKCKDMMRRSITLFVVYQPVGDIKVPDEAPTLPKGRFVRGRLSQMRRSIGMTESEIDALMEQQGGGGDTDNTPSLTKDPNLPPSATPTWADIVAQRERAGRLYSPKTIQESFPYMNGNPAGVPDFKDAFREEQMLAHMDAPSNHPMDVYAQLFENRVRVMFGWVIWFFIGMWGTMSYLKEMRTERDQSQMFSQDSFMLTEDEAVRRVRDGHEELVPIIRHVGLTPIVKWVPQSKAAHMMWNERPGLNHASVSQLRFATVGIYNLNYDEYSYPGTLSALVDTPESQVKWQEYQKNSKFNLSPILKERKIDGVPERQWNRIDEATKALTPLEE